MTESQADLAEPIHTEENT
jgi:hypothetical protein